MSGAIRYVCLSDLHLGDRDSILTSISEDGHSVDASAASPVLRALADGLGDLFQDQQPTLIVNGDFLDLAFGSLNVAMMMFERLAELTLAPDRRLFDGLIYLPGNHDHHLWEMTREGRFYREVVTRHHVDGMPPPIHTTRCEVEGGFTSHLLEAMIAHVYPEESSPAVRPRVRVHYPNLALLNAAGNRCVLIHHGHFVEPLYSLFSRGRQLLFPTGLSAQTLEELETENFAWIDFVWSLLGRSGTAGRDAETIFEMLRYPQKIRRFAADVAGRAAPLLRTPLVPFNWARRLLLRYVLGRVVRRITGERSQVHQILTSGARDGMRDYLFGPSSRQLRDELGSVPSDLTFVFGHTHKPFEAVVAGPGEGPPVLVVNTGGWTVDTDHGSAAFGASIVLISEDMETATLRVYQDGKDACRVVGEVRVPTDGIHEGRVARPHDGFAWQIQERLETPAARAGFANLERVVHDAVSTRRRLHRARFS